ncbi:uncharacterized protein LOC133883038 [Alnus glutinosa]|uniref:uncharacterized protein LOC133883038 n=1 Tax=Alnus glutinosa TaxID=3517 RepID=UPI002D7996D2|nr:uncharacterized protein LOC133883038 [Alnus glutinosa]
MRQFVEMVCNREFMNKAPDEAWDYFDLLAENAQVWDTTERTDKAKLEPSSRGGLYHIKADEDISDRIATLTRKVEALELSKVGVTKNPKPIEISCEICEANVHLTKDCPTILAFKEVLHEQANAANAYQRPFSSPYSETYNPNLRNHPNFSWRNGQSANEPQGSSSHAPYVPPHKQTLEETLQAFIQSQNQINQEVKNSIGRIESQLNVREKGKFPAQPEPNPRTRAGVNEVSNTQVEHAKSITILRSGKMVNKEVPTKVSPSKGDFETKEDGKPSEGGDVVEKVYEPVAPFPQRLLAPKKGTENQDILEVFKQVKINIPLLDAIKQIPSYAIKTYARFGRKIHWNRRIPIMTADPGGSDLPGLTGSQDPFRVDGF